eukprot:scaffold35612_cov18-Tisochrysis_lutea.AAC.1
MALLPFLIVAKISFRRVHCKGSAGGEQQDGEAAAQLISSMADAELYPAADSRAAAPTAQGLNPAGDSQTFPEGTRRL